MTERGTQRVWPIIRSLLEDEELILDAGCGEHRWEKKGCVVTRCDNTQHYYNRTEALEDIDDVDLNGPWPYADDSFDAVVAADVIEHLENLWHFYREATRVATKSVVISTPNVESIMSRTMFFRTGELWGFCKEERKKSFHITPIFLWQVRAAAMKVGWQIGEVRRVSCPVPENRSRRLQIEDVAMKRNNQRWNVVKVIP